MGAPMDKEDKEGKDDEKNMDADEKKDSAKSLQKDDDEDKEEDEEADEDEKKEEKADTVARWFMVKGVAEGECEIISLTSRRMAISTGKTRTPGNLPRRSSRSPLPSAVMTRR